MQTERSLSEQSLEIGKAEQEKLIQSVSMINEVAKRLKQIPELPSEKPTDNHPLIKVEFPDEGEVFTYMQGYDYPYRGYPYYEFVDKIDLIKKLSRNLQSGLFHGLKNTWTRYLLIPFIPSLGRSVFWACTYTFHRLIVRFQMRTNRYSQAVAEIHRAATISWSDESAQTTELRKMLRDIECMILEMDNAYRFRVQDLLPELNKSALAQNPRQEINRLLDIWISREQTQEIKDSWTLLKLFNNYYLRFDKPLLKLITRVLSEIDPTKVAMTAEDKYFATPRKDYKFRFQITPTPEDQKVISQAQLQQSHDEKFNAIRKQSTVEHEMLKRAYELKLSNLPPIENAAEQTQRMQEQFSKESLVLDDKFNQQLLQAEKEYLEAKNKL